MSRQAHPIRLILILTLVAAVAVAGQSDGRQRVVVVGNDGQEATVTLTGKHLQVVAVDDGNRSVHEFDFSCLEDLIDEALTSAMAGLETAFEDLEDQEFSIRLDGANEIVVSHGDQVAALNLEVIAAQIERTLADIHVDFTRELGATESVHGADERDEAERLREELDNLKAELARMRSNLQRAR